MTPLTESDLEISPGLSVTPCTSRHRDYVVLDMEMTGLSPKTEKVIEIGAIRVRGGKEIAELSCIVNPGKAVPERITQLTGITSEMTAAGKPMDEAMEELLEFMGDDILVGQNIRFDYSFLAQWCINKKKSIRVRAVDTLKIARALLPAEQSKKLEDLCVFFQIPRINGHRALDDARETRQIFEILQDRALAQLYSPGHGEILNQNKNFNQDCAFRQSHAINIEESPLLKPQVLVYKAKRQTPATAHQIRNLKEYMARHHLIDDIVWEGLTRNEASRIQDYYYSTYGKE